MNDSPAPSASSRGKPSPVLIVFLIFPILGLIAAVGLALSDMNSASSPTPLPVSLADTSLIGKSAPNFELTGLNGEQYRLSNYRGQVVFLNFWATWCEPCKRELPAFAQFSQNPENTDSIILAVNLAETSETINDYFNQYGISGLTVLLDEDLNIQGTYRTQQYPTTYVIDPAGIVRYRHLGEMHIDDLTAYVNELSPVNTDS